MSSVAFLARAGFTLMLVGFAFYCMNKITHNLQKSVPF